MMHLGLDAPGLGGSGVAVVPAQVGMDGGIPLGMAGVIGAVEGEATQGLELALDEVEPARVGGQVDELPVRSGASQAPRGWSLPWHPIPRTTTSGLACSGS